MLRGTGQSPDDLISITRHRLDQLLESEIVHHSLIKPQNLTLQKILKIKDYRDVTQLLGEELPTRYAVRIKLLESIPGWERQKNLRHVRKVYADSFKAVRLSHDGSPRALERVDPEDFLQAIADIKRRHANVVHHFMVGMTDLRNRGLLKADEVDHFMTAFFTSRMGTEALSTHFLSMVQLERPDGIIDIHCDPAEVLKDAAEAARDIFRRHYKNIEPPVVEVTVGGAHGTDFPP